MESGDLGLSVRSEPPTGGPGPRPAGARWSLRSRAAHDRLGGRRGDHGRGLLGRERSPFDLVLTSYEGTVNRRRRDRAVPPIAVDPSPLEAKSAAGRPEA